MLNCIAFLTNRHSMIPVCLFNGPWSMLTSSSPPLVSLPESTTLITKGPTVSCLKLTVHESIADNTRLSTRHCYYIVLEQWKLVKKNNKGNCVSGTKPKKTFKVEHRFFSPPYIANSVHSLNYKYWMAKKTINPWSWLKKHYRNDLKSPDNKINTQLGRHALPYSVYETSLVSR